jgi:hypothetical protein
VDRGQAGVAGRGGVASGGFQVGQKGGDQPGVHLGDVEAARGVTGGAEGEFEQ